MEEIYRTPKSALTEPSTEKPKTHWFWRFFFWLHVAMSPIWAFGIAFMDGLTTLDYIDLLTFPPIVVALFGFVYTKKIGSKLFWRIFNFFYLVWVFFYSIIAALILKIPQYGEVIEIDGWFIIGPMFVIPTCIALWLYASSFADERNF